MGTNESLLHDALESIMPAYHLALDGDAEEGCVYALSRVRSVYESDVPIMAWEEYEVYVYQREYDSDRVTAVIQALRNVGFLAAPVARAQTMEGGYYRDAVAARMLVAAQE